MILWVEFRRVSLESAHLCIEKKNNNKNRFFFSTRRTFKLIQPKKHTHKQTADRCTHDCKMKRVYCMYHFVLGPLKVFMPPEQFQRLVVLNWSCWWPNTSLSHFMFHLPDEPQTEKQSYNKGCQNHLWQRLADDRDEISEDPAVRRKQKPHQTEASTKALLTVSWIQSSCYCKKYQHTNCPA